MRSGPDVHTDHKRKRKGDYGNVSSMSPTKTLPRRVLDIPPAGGGASRAAPVRDRR